MIVTNRALFNDEVIVIEIVIAKGVTSRDEQFLCVYRLHGVFVVDAMGGRQYDVGLNYRSAALEFFLSRRFLLDVQGRVPWEIRDTCRHPVYGKRRRTRRCMPASCNHHANTTTLKLFQGSHMICDCAYVLHFHLFEYNPIRISLHTVIFLVVFSSRLLRMRSDA